MLKQYAEAVGEELLITPRVLIVGDNFTWRKILREKISKALQNITQAGDESIVVVDRFNDAWASLNEKGPWYLLVTDIRLSVPIHNSQKLWTKIITSRDQPSGPCRRRSWAGLAWRAVAPGRDSASWHLLATCQSGGVLRPGRHREISVSCNSHQ